MNLSKKKTIPIAITWFYKTGWNGKVMVKNYLDTSKVHFGMYFPFDFSALRRTFVWRILWAQQLKRKNSEKNTKNRIRIPMERGIKMWLNSLRVHTIRWNWVQKKTWLNSLTAQWNDGKREWWLYSLILYKIQWNWVQESLWLNSLKAQWNDVKKENCD